MAESEQFERGLEIRREVLGADCVDANVRALSRQRDRPPDRHEACARRAATSFRDA
jgi:hypothetical protein